MVISVLPIKLSSLNDLVRLVADIKKDRSVLIGYKVGERYRLGFYLPPQFKGIQGVFVYHDVDDRPEIISFSPNDGGREVIDFGFKESPSYLNIFCSYIDSPPHKFVKISDYKVSIARVNVSDLFSFVNLAYSTVMENVLIPFSWVVNGKELILNVEVPSDDDNDHLIVFRYVTSSLVETPYLSFDPKTGDIEYASVPMDISKRYLLLVGVDKFFIS